MSNTWQPIKSRLQNERLISSTAQEIEKMKVSCICLIWSLGQDRCKQPFLLIYTGAVAAVRGAFALADGVICIINVATAEIPQERCSTCNRVLSSPGSRAMCMALEAVEVDLQTTTGRWL